MAKFKKYFILVFMLFLSFVIVACGADKEPPTITVESDTITHEVNKTHDFLAGVTVTDNVSKEDKIKVEVSDWGTYDKSKIGNYEIIIKATDEKGNFSEKKITVKVVAESDKLAPMIDVGSNVPINHLAGEEYDLTAGLTGVDNFDGVNISFKVVDLQGYKNDKAGTYKVKIVAFDKAGNESAPIERTVIVSESYARAEMTSFEGEIIRYKALYNPQVFNGHTATGFNTAYNGHFVNVLSKDYVEWILEYAPERLGSGVGWSVIAVTDKDNKIVYVRHWSSGEAFHEDGELVSQRAHTWSTGTVYTWTEQNGDQIIPKSNARYSSGEMGMMMANINERIPQGGHVFMFMNWTSIKEDENGNVALKANEPDMPRSMGANYIMNSDEDGDEVMDYAIGRTLEIKDPELSDQVVRQSFDPANPFPIISIPGSKYVNSSGVWRINYTDKVYLADYSEENPYNPLVGVAANDGKGNDITSSITYKVYRYTTTELKYGLVPSLAVTDPLWAEYFDNAYKLSENEVELANVLVPENDQVHFVVEYTVTANGKTDKAYRLIQVQAQYPDYVELYGETDTVYSNIFGMQQRLEMNPNVSEFGNLAETDKGIIYDAASIKKLTLPVISKGVVVLLNNKYQVQLVRVNNGTIFELNKYGNVLTSDLSWEATDALAGVKDLVPENGYVLVYPEGKAAEVLNKALRAFYDYDFTGGTISTIAAKNGAVQIELILKEVQEVSTLVVNDEAPEITINDVVMTVNVIENSLSSLVFLSTGGGAGFRLDTGKAYFYTKDQYAVLSAAPEVVTSFTTASPNKGVPWFRDGVIIVVDEDGKFVLARVMTTTHAAEVKADGTVIFGNEAAVATTEATKEAAGEANLTWDLVVPNAANAVAHGPLMDIMDVIPNGGGFFILPGSKTADVRNLGVRLVWNKNYPGTGAISDATLEEKPENAATNGFDFDTFDAEYFANLVVVSDFVSTVTEKAAKLARPKVTVQDNTMTWAKIDGAASYDLYVNGALLEKGVGTLDEETNLYSFDLGSLGLLADTYKVQLRAITADAKQKSTSVLSDAVDYECERLSTPTNFELNEGVLSWNAVTGAVKYLVTVAEEKAVEVTDNSFTIPTEFLVNDVVIKVVAVGDGAVLDSAVAQHILNVAEMEIVIGKAKASFKQFTLDKWMTYIDPDGGNDIGAAGIAGLVVVKDLAGIDALSDSTKLFNGGYLVLVDKDMKVKYIATRWGQSWDANNGWQLNGADKDAQWAWGANILASYVKPHLADGDMLILASQYAKGLPEGNYRNLLGNQLIKDLGSLALANDHRYITTFEEAINPSTVNIVIREVIPVTGIQIGETTMGAKEFTLEDWLKYADPNGGNDVGAQHISGLVIVTDLDAMAELDGTTKLFSGGYLVLVDYKMKVKYIATRWGQSWDATNGWQLNGANKDAQWAWGDSLFASYVKPHFKKGDMLILASQYAKGLTAGNYRNLVGNELIKDLGTPAPATDHRSVLEFDEAIDPSTVEIAFKVAEEKDVLQIGSTVVDRNSFTLEEWLNYADPNGGNDVGASRISGFVLVTDLAELANTEGATKLHSGGYMALVDKDMKVKYIATRWGQSWDETDGWQLNGANQDARWAWGLNLLASYVKPLLAEGDMLIFASQYPTTGAMRNIFGNELIQQIESGDHRNVLEFDNAIDPSTVTIKSFVQITYKDID